VEFEKGQMIIGNNSSQPMATLDIDQPKGRRTRLHSRLSSTIQQENASSNV